LFVDAVANRDPPLVVKVGVEVLVEDERGQFTFA
jgi:hypothetical protein